MMKKCLTLTIALILLAGASLPIGLALASDISNAKYSGVVLISNNSTAANKVSVNCSIDTQTLIDDWGVDEDFTYTAVRNATGNDVPYMPSVNSSYPWCFWVPAINADSFLNYVLYLGVSDMVTTRYYFPGPDGMTTEDSATLELGDNFTIEQKGYIDTTAVGADLFRKTGAIAGTISAAGNITIPIYGDTTWVNPTSFNDPDSGWSSEASAYDDNTTTYASSTEVDAKTWSEFLELTREATDLYSARYYFTSQSSLFSEIDLDTYYGEAWHDEYSGAVTLGSYTTISFDDARSDVTKIRVRFYNNHASSNDIARLNELDYGLVTETVSVTASGISSGEHKVEVYADDDGRPESTTLSVNASANDAREKEDDGSVMNNSEYCSMETNIYPSGRYWAGFRWELTIPKGSTINVAYVTLYIPNEAHDDPNTNLHFELGAAPAQFTNDNYDITSRSRTSNSTSWVEDGIGDEWQVSPSLVTPLQELVNAYDITALVLITRPNQDAYKIFSCRAWDYLSGYVAPKIHIEYTTPAFLAIEVDDVEKDVSMLSGASVPDNSNDWTFCEADAMPYMEYQKIWVDGVLQQHIEWEYDTTFTDLSGKGHDATPTFRTETSDEDVTATLISFSPVELATAPAYSVTGGTPFITENITQSANFTTAVSPTDFPGAAVIEEVSEASGTPSQIPFTILVALTGIIFGLGVVYAMARAGQKSSIVVIGVEIIVLAVGIALKVIDFWMLGLFLIIAIALAMGSRHITFGMPSGGNLIGMLATDFVGLTLINRWIEGSMMKAAETDVINTLMFTNSVELFGFTFPGLNVNFFLKGLPRLLKWDYSFFGGNAQLLQYFLYSITAVVSFILFLAIIGMLSNYFTRLR